MSSQRRWWLGALGSMIALGAIGSWGCCSVTCCDKKPRNQLIIVSPTAEGVQPDPVVISKKQHQEIVWKLSAGSTIQRIDITLRPDQPPSPGSKWPPFAVCGPDPNVCGIACKEMLCQSGPINPALEPAKKGTYYDYKFITLVGQASTDPGIRIDP